MSTTEQQSTNAALVTESLSTPAHLRPQVVQKGVFDIDDLHWTKRALTVGANKGGTIQEACIPTDRLDDFIAGVLYVWQLSAGVQQSNTVTPCAACRLVPSRQNKLLCNQD